MVQVESLHRSFSIVIRHPLFDVLVDDVFYIVADVGPYVVVYVGADVGAYVVVYVSVDVGACAVVYVVLLIFPMGGQAFRSSGASEHVGFLPR